MRMHTIRTTFREVCFVYTKISSMISNACTLPFSFTASMLCTLYMLVTIRSPTMNKSKKNISNNIMLIVTRENAKNLTFNAISDDNNTFNERKCANMLSTSFRGNNCILEQAIDRERKDGNI